MTRSARRGRRSESAQGVLETALILPIMIALVVNFIGIMIVVQLKAQVQAAASLAAQSTIAAPVNDINDSCVFARDTFYQTVFSVTPFTGYSGCPANPAVGASSSFTVSVTAPPPGTQVLQLTNFTCASGVPVSAGNYFSGVGYPGPTTVSCSVNAKVDFSKTPLAFGILWNPSFQVVQDATPPSARQCGQAVCP